MNRKTNINSNSNNGMNTVLIHESRLHPILTSLLVNISYNMKHILNTSTQQYPFCVGTATQIPLSDTQSSANNGLLYKWIPHANSNYSCFVTAEKGMNVTDLA